MAKFRKDKVPYMDFFLVNLLWGVSSFLNAEMIKIAMHHMNNETKSITTFYVFFTSSTLILLLIRVNVVFTLLTLVWWNLVLHCIMLIFLFYPPKKSLVCYAFLASLGYTASLCLVCSLNVASYTPSGVRGLVVGVSLIYFTSYLFSDSLIYPSDGKVPHGSIAFIILRIVLALLSLKFYKRKLEEMFGWECGEVTSHLTAENIGSWILEGEAKDPRADLILKEYMPSFVDFAGFWGTVKENTEDLCPLIVFILLILSTSFFSPMNTSATLVLSRYNLERIYRIDIIASLLGAFAGLPQFRLFSKWYIVVPAYLVHLIFLTIVLFGQNTYRFNIYASRILMCFSTFICASVGSWLLVVCLLQFITNKLEVKCNNSGTGSPCCCDYSEKKCFCSMNIKKECCSKENCNNGTENCTIWVTWSNNHSFRAWNPSDCLFCTSQNCEKIGTKNSNGCSCGSGSSGGSSCSCSCNRDSKHYLLRNCRTSSCPYCDLTVVLECVCLPTCPQSSGKCTCSCCPAKVEGTLECKTVSLNLEKCKYKLCTYAPCENLDKFMCCCTEKGNCVEGSAHACPCDDKRHSCCCCPLRPEVNGKKRCGRHFKLVGCEICSCCHYDLKILLCYKEANTRFLIGQKPFPDKFDRIGGLMFNSPCCCDSTSCGGKKDHCDITKIPFRLCSSEMTAGITCNKGKCTCTCGGCGTVGNSGQCCSHIKVVPSGLPYQYRAKDIKRYGIINALTSSVVFLLLFKVIMALVFSTVNKKEDISLIVPIDQMKRVNGLELTVFNQPYKTDLSHARMLFPSFDGSEEDLVSMAVEEEEEKIAVYAKLTKLALGGLEASSYDNWLQNSMANQPMINGESFSRLRYVNHVSSFLYFALSEYVHKYSFIIMAYLDRCSSKWDVEFKDFERRVISQLNVSTKQSTDLLKMGIHYANPKLQKRLNKRQREIWERIYDDTRALSEDLNTLTKLERRASATIGEDLLANMIELWEFRATLLKKWTKNRTIFLNWASFLAIMDNISLWKVYYLDIYYEKHAREIKSGNIVDIRSEIHKQSGTKTTFDIHPELQKESQHRTFDLSKIKHSTSNTFDLSKVKHTTNNTFDLSKIKHSTSNTFDLSKVKHTTNNTFDLSKVKHTTNNTFDLSKVRHTTSNTFDLSKVKHTTSNTFDLSKVKHTTSETFDLGKIKHPKADAFDLSYKLPKRSQRYDMLDPGERASKQLSDEAL